MWPDGEWGSTHEDYGFSIKIFYSIAVTMFDIVQVGDDEYDAYHIFTFNRNGRVGHVIYGARYREWFQQNPFNAEIRARDAFNHFLGAYFVAVTQVLRKLPPCLERYVWAF